MIQVNNISKSYEKITALKDVSFEVTEGEVFGLIGPDGAGKTSLFRILATLRLPDHGSASIAGNDLADYRTIRSMIGYMPGRFSLYQDLSVEENLRFFATIYGTTIEQNYRFIRDIYTQIEPFKKRRAGALSGGMKQKLALSCVLVHRPSILILDEPTTGVDPVSRREFWEILSTLQKSGMTLLVSTPFMDEAAQCDRIALIHKGEILRIDTPDGIRDSYGKTLYAVSSNRDLFTVLNDLNTYPHKKSAEIFGSSVHFTDQREGVDTPGDIRAYLLHKGHDQVDVREKKPDIEDVFIQLMTQEA